ncbi:hypothetical protein ACKWTF_007345 [Chironomus riparius]
MYSGVCTQSPVFGIIMEFCAYGALNQLLKEGSKIITPSRVVSWSKQIATGMSYLHSHKIIHRDLKSPNILIGDNETIKISDFGTCREWNGLISTKMSFCGTVAWMAPEVIRNEPCSERIDVWSYGVVLWELLTCQSPYRNFDSSAIIWGVGNYSLNLPIPTNSPEGYALLMKQCWSVKPKNRPSFKIILSHLEIAGAEILSKYNDNYETLQKTWQKEINDKLITQVNNSTRVYEYERDLIRKRQEEWKHAKDIRLIYERKLERTNNLYLELTSCFAQLEEREREIADREKHYGSNKFYKNQICSFKKQQLDKFSRRKITLYPSISSELNSPSPSSPTSPPIEKSSVYVHFNGNSTKTVLSQNQTSSAKHPLKKRHRRTGSGSSFTRNSSSERCKRLISAETQTDHDITDISKSDSISDNLTSEKMHSEPSQSIQSSDSSSGETDIDDHAPREDTTSSSQTNHLNMINSMATSVMTCSNFSFDDPIKECSDDDLETLRQKVSNLITDTSSTSSTSTIINKQHTIKANDAARKLDFDENMNDSMNITTMTVQNENSSPDINRIIETSLANDINNASLLRRKSITRLPVRSRRLHKNASIDNELSPKHVIEKRDMYYADLSSNDDTDVLNDDKRNNNELLK